MMCMLSYSQRMEQLREKYGNRCFYCGSKKYLQFAHLLPTRCVGMGRGIRKRYHDIKKNTGKYELLCKECHHSMDNREEFRFTDAVYGKGYGFDYHVGVGDYV